MEAKRQNTVSQGPSPLSQGQPGPQPPLPGTGRLRGNAALCPEEPLTFPGASHRRLHRTAGKLLNLFVHTPRPGWSTQFVGLCAVRMWGPLFKGD